jgi:hypothetical protein
MFKRAFRLVYRVRGRCSRHPAYNPAKDAQAGIKGGMRGVLRTTPDISGLSHTARSDRGLRGHGPLFHHQRAGARKVRGPARICAGGATATGAAAEPGRWRCCRSRGAL